MPMSLGVDCMTGGYRLCIQVERCVGKLKSARRVTTRYDKTAESFPGPIDIASIRLRLRLLPT